LEVAEVTNQNPMQSLNKWILSWPHSSELWTIHVDELSDWNPSETTYEAWITELVRLWALAMKLTKAPGVVIAALNFRASEHLELFSCLSSVPIDTMTPPSMYILDSSLEFPADGEQYYRVLTKTEFRGLPKEATAVVRSARSLLAVANSWEFDNTLYIAAKFGE
jgi:hypothetical protein